MKNTVGGVVLVSALICGCSVSRPTPAVARQPASAGSLQAPVLLLAGSDEPVARLPGLVISQRQFLDPLIEGHGLPVLLNVVQLELAKQNAQRKGLKLAPEDLRQERERTLEQAFAESDNKTQEQIEAAVAKGDESTAERLRQGLRTDRERALEQLLAQQRVSKPEFDLVMQTNAYLRKLAESEMQEISDEVLRKAFETEYGATVKVRHIQLGTREELARAQVRLKAGEPFEKVAREMSRNPRTAAAGGLLPKFSLATTNVPDNFKQAAFTLNEGQVSDAVFADGAFHLIKLEQKLAPRAVKFEGVKESLRAKVREQIILNGVALLRDKLLDQTRAALKIEDPVLREQFARGLEKRQQQMNELKEQREKVEREQRPGQRQPQGGGAGAPPVDPGKVLPVPGAR